MNRYLKDLQSILEANQGILKESTVLYLLRQILYSLEYIHSKGYAHGDIKAANIMLKSDKEAYLLDYGLVHRFSRDGTHQAYQPKPDRRHNGTIEFTSRDAHAGVTPNRRADLEILLYCIVQWLSGTLPWMDVLNKPEEVQKLKVKYMEKSKEFLDFCFKNTKNNVQSKSFGF
jgi:vaccinia related kinase